jgi:hypothetical protein
MVSRDIKICPANPAMGRPCINQRHVDNEYKVHLAFAN